jgi:hypothetical protein
LPRATKRDDRPAQQAQPGACVPFVCDSAFGACALRSLVACAVRRPADMVEQCGAVRITRGAGQVHAGHGDGSSHSAIARMTVNGPQSSQRYS